ADERGAFLVDDDGVAAAVVATSAGHRRAVVQRGGGFARFVVLELGGPPLSITRRVVGETGRGLAAVKGWGADATLLAEPRRPESTEGGAAGCQSMEGIGELQRLGRPPTNGGAGVGADAGRAC